MNLGSQDCSMVLFPKFILLFDQLKIFKWHHASLWLWNSFPLLLFLNVGLLTCAQVGDVSTRWQVASSVIRSGLRLCG